MTNKKQKLELTWIGKDEELKLEPRILIEDPKKSYGDPQSENMLIHGDNLLALKALEQDFTNKIKCIYIDPPYNIDAAGVPYDDFIEHSLWLSLMKPRLEILQRLLSNDGAIFVSINYIELGYLMILMNEIYGRDNFQNIITVKTATTASFRAINSCPVNVSEHILIYSKNKDYFKSHPLYWKTDYSEDYSHYIENFEDDPHNWKLVSLDQKANKHFEVEDWRGLKEKMGESWKEERYNYKRKIAFSEPEKVVSLNTLQKPSKKIQDIIDESKMNRDSVFEIKRDDLDSIYCFNGRTLAFFKKKFRIVEGENSPAEIITNIWDDISFLSLGTEGGVDFPNSKKPEKLIYRIFQLLASNKDWVLDSFLGSGTTSAVANKLGLNWIGIELGEHANTHCIPRLKSVVNGTDQSGISKIVNWRGGGGFKFYNLASSLLRKDSFGNFVINEKYNANMLAAAMCKHEGFKYSPDESLYWKQGKSTETDYIFVTTGFVTVEQLDAIHAQMTQNESLLICAKSFASESENHFSNITVKKIPQMILGKCEFGKDNYDLNIIKANEQ